MSTEFLDLPQLISAGGTVRLPGSKSISNRVLLLAALAEGTTEVRDLLASDDTERMLDALQTLGVGVASLGGESWTITGCGGHFPVRQAELFLGNAGTAFRPLTAALALAGGDYVLKGVARMHERPIGDLVDGLRQLGADISYLGNEGFPPLQLKPAAIQPGGVVKVRGDVSSQFLTGLLMALPLTGETVAVDVVGELISKPYIEITLAIMARFGVVVERDGWQRFTVKAGSRYVSPGTIYVEGDASSASYFLALGAIGGGPVRVEGVGSESIQGDVKFAEALAQMGAVITTGPNWMEARAPQGGLVAVDLDCNHIPDAAMTLATAALFARGATTLRNIASWRVKETDRIAAMATELRKLGADVEEGADYIRVTPASLQPAAIDTYDDHRMAMCFSLAAFGTPLRINDPKCVGKTFPDYFACFAGVSKAAPVIAIDGPSASGKGTVAARVAAALGYDYLDSGALYRLTALAAQKSGVDWADESGVAAIATRLDVEFTAGDIRLNGELVGDSIRTEEISAGASKVAALPAVRDALLFRQRTFNRAPGLIGDGRDMGSVVFPQAPLKVFLTASAEARAERRYKQLIEKGFSANLADLLLDLQQRDERDSQRSVAPLRQEADAKLLDTTGLTIEQAVNQVLAWSKEAM
ncbi:bifunctional 3-phosphoshikimate 1-carboxyvinyltransferase/cytidylate kinase [Quatrionicoccus australiensis]|uniref:bifunctional 3-phosphoshikimate 1-carboxyvinyltransferase/cytidylate kinase n=1 Tax=Quatrionicoccus australiensis TaxID=138118 RepID=UPI001CFC393B|nr:bifunctional 3-phosphoshikimate 1-carboxyvinyltransferase/cytidylate kinase [Quatrionicoccus australiensis]MCB4358902.1 bifunctional 3-phosphoshikimate 1-carboxyvinyltransferase/cytidylate kinase [Quatrionicoccus australiensis]